MLGATPSGLVLTSVSDSKHGKGPLISGDVVRDRGYDDTYHTFYTHPATVGGGSRDFALWRPAVDTLFPAVNFAPAALWSIALGLGWKHGVAVGTRLQDTASMLSPAHLQHIFRIQLKEQL